ncbi:carbohydrate kinase [Rhizobium sp. CG5]|uniref:carbohydrate kinase family protein n=1 Tax=Rhizobium sp. CG5 TaxID=2726076 RepID=UPI002034914F|nr:carbohydrate kinase family protein [Rhizobium sp. CG5]MCM2477019.1 carbohydrate kinase [Rhizobium sp. CG5]
MSGGILVFGGAHVDRRGRIHGATVPGASNPGHFLEEPGGGAFNAARALARLQHRTVMISPRGGDAAGAQVSAAALSAGIDDRPFVFLDRATPSYTAILERDGNLVVAIADMDLYRMFSPRRLKVRAVREAMSAAGAILCDANLPDDTLTAITKAARAEQMPVFAIAISPVKVLHFRASLEGLDLLFMNGAEAASLAGRRPDEPGGWPALLRAEGLRSGVITSGAQAVIAFDETSAFRLAPPPLECIADVTGAGDGLAAGTIAGLMAGLPLNQALRRGAALAALTLESRHATAENLSPALLESRVALVPEPELLS